MAEHDQEFLRGIFLMEAWDTVATVEEGLPRLLEPALSSEALLPLVVVAHRLKGAAALHGFPGTAELAGLLETMLERVSERGGGIEAHGLVVDLLAALKPILDGIAAQGVEDAAASEAFRAGHPAAFEPDGSAGSPLRRPGDALLHDARHFLAEHGDVLPYFGPEAAEHLETITRSLLALEQSGPNPGAAELHALFRAVHTLKGAAYTVGCEAVGWVAHRAEDVLSAVREGRLRWSPAVVDTLLRATDAIKVLLGSPDAPVGEPAAVIEDAVQALAAVPAGDLGPAGGAPLVEVDGAVVPEAAALEPAAPVPAAEHPVGEASPPSEALRPARTSIRVSVGRLDALMNLVGELVIARSRLERRFRQLERLDDLLTVSRSRMSRTVRDFEGKYLDPHLRFTEDDVAAARPGAPGRDGFAPVSALFAELEFDRYDDFNILARTIGELSADLGEIQAQLATAIRSIEEDTRHVQRLTASLRGEITRSRMVPIGKLFGRFPRRVRELAGPTGRLVRLELSGEAVEVDNAVIEQIADPLLHLIQNAVVHGIEPEAERLAQGKPPQGRVALAAHQRGGTMVVEVEDDGRGIAVGAVRELAVQRGMLSPEAATRLGDREVLSLLFLPGFSTAASVTDVAGRGVGLDVVRTNVARVNGEVDVETEPGVGTRFTLRLPLALAISDALMVRSGGETLALPLGAVRQIVTRRPQDVRGVGPSEMVRVEGQLLDLYRLDRVLGLVAAEAGAARPGMPALPVPVLVVRSGGRSFAIAVDAIVGKEEIVIKPLGGLLAGLPPFGGATITGEGRVILLVDPARLLALAESGIGRVSEPREAVVAAPAPAVSPSLAGAARRVLLVDDSVSVRRFVGRMLENGGFEVLTANDGAEALERLVDTTVDVVVTDLEMPRVNGYELIENLRRRPSTQEVPVVVLTTRAGEKHWALARRLGVRHYVTKPVDEQAFVRLVTDVAAAAPEVEPSGVLG
jgi:chemosensory pili system protein ChpA (sensor histidine kinase/response regulator)